MIRRAILPVLVAALAGAATAEPDRMAPRLGAATNFGQGWKPEVLDASRRLPVRDFRDAVYWRRVERTPGRFVFEDPRDRFPDLLAGMGAVLSLTVNNGHPGWDDGNTPLSPEAVAAFARYAARAAVRFPAVKAVEVGNEMNSDRFVSGPGWDVPLAERAVSYTALLKATAAAVRAARPGVRILGGAAHSIPLAWFGALSRAGAPAFMDAVVIHPYTVPAEELRRQIGLLRAVPGFAEMPVEVTEFGHSDPGKAPAHLLKSYCAMALSGVTRAVWYPLAARGDGLAPLLDADGAPTAVGRAYALIGRELEGRPVADAAPDPFTYACAFGPGRLVIWGEPRAVALAPELQALDAEGQVLPAEGLALSMEHPLLIRSETAAVALGDTVRLGPQPVLADSYHQFAYPEGGTPGPFVRIARARGREAPMETRPGQEKGGVPWVPYLGSGFDGMLRAGAGWVLPAGGGDRPAEVIYRHEAAADTRVDIVVSVAPADRSTDGVVFSLSRDGREQDRQVVTEAAVLRYPDVALRAGEVLDFAIGPGDSARGDVTRFRVSFRRPGR